MSLKRVRGCKDKAIGKREAEATEQSKLAKPRNMRRDRDSDWFGNESSVDEMVNAVESGAITEQELQSIGEATIEYTELELLLGQSEKIHREIHEALETKAREVEKWQERLEEETQ